LKKQLSLYYRLFFLLITVSFTTAVIANTKKVKPEFYQIKVYHFNDSAQEKMLDVYLRNAFLPALHKAGIKKVGVFKAIANDTATDKLLYVFITLKSPEHLLKLSQQLDADAVYQAAGSDYINAFYKNPPYTSMESILLKAFSLAPEMQLPDLKAPFNERIYELRSYESATEKIYRNKVQMFNEGGEIDLFKRLEFNAIFYAEVINGSHMPNLMYMTSFENKTARDAHWKAFGADPEWKKLSSMPEYKNNVSHIDITFLRATAYSDF
jgi:hypothetical protein